MKLKYYLRGLGIGIVVTALVMGVSLNNTEKIEDIPQKDSVLTELVEATQEKSIEDNESSDTIQNKEESKIQESPKKESSSEESSETVSTESVITEQELSETESIVPSQEKLSATPNSAELTDEGKLIQIVVNNGEGSNHVSKKLAEANLVESAASYDQFLCQNGYDKRLVAGTHMIPAGATDDEIAQILCSRN